MRQIVSNFRGCGQCIARFLIRPKIGMLGAPGKRIRGGSASQVQLCHDSVIMIVFRPYKYRDNRKIRITGKIMPPFIRCFFCIVTAVILGFAPSFAHAGNFNEPLFDESFDYSAVPLRSDCQQEITPRTRYFECRDASGLYEAALKHAREKKQPLMVIFGFDECPACFEVERLYFTFKGKIKKTLFSNFVSDKEAEKENLPTLTVVRIHIRNPSGEALAERLGLIKYANARDWHRVWSPFIMIVDPATGKWHSEERWEDPEYYCYGHLAEVAVSLEELGFLEKGRTMQFRTMCKE